MYKNNIHEVIETAAGLSLSEKFILPIWEKQTEINFPRIPYGLFLQIAKWQTEIAEKHRCESSCSIFLVDGEWIAVPFYQQNTAGSMTIDTDFEKDERNATLLGKYADLSPMHATLHNHVSGIAGQSGTDFKDELNLYGPHITIGNLNQNKMSFHARLSVYQEGKHRFIPLKFTEIIDVPVPPGANEAMMDALEAQYLNVDRKLCPDYPEEWQDRFEFQAQKTYTQLWSGGTGYQAPVLNHQPVDPDKWDQWDEMTDEEWAEEKKRLSKSTGSGGATKTFGTNEWVGKIIAKLPLTSYQEFLEGLKKLRSHEAEGVAAAVLKAQVNYKQLYEALKKNQTVNK